MNLLPRRQTLVLSFPIRRALGLPAISSLIDNGYMQPISMFQTAIESRDYSKAIRLLSSVKSLQTQSNIMACAVDSDRAFELLKFVPNARLIKEVLNIASFSTRIARLIAEDLPESTDEAILIAAINGDRAWADRYQAKFSLTDKYITKLMDKTSSSRAQQSTRRDSEASAL